MRRRARIYIVVLWTAFLSAVSAGCAGAELLEEVPRDFALIWEKPDPARNSQGAGISNLARGTQGGQGAGAQTADAGDGQEDSGGTQMYGRAPRALAEHPAESGGETARTVSFLMEEAFSYAYDCLSEAEQIWYRDIERILGGFEEDIPLSVEGLEAGLEESCIDRIFQCVLCDHPELFYVDGYSYTKYLRGENLLSIEFSGSYSVDLETALARSREIQTAADAILAGAEDILAGPDASDYEKVKYVYDTLILSTDYSLDAPDSQNIYSVFVKHLSVCQGYAKATQYLLNRLGVECALVLGTVETGEGHAWNLVKVDGQYYYVDTTWGDASYRGDDGLSWEGAMPQINYDFLNVTTEELLRTHTVGGEVPMPVCTAVEANYYVREGAFFTSCDREQMRGLFQRAAESGRRDVSVKCANEDCYRELLQTLIEEQEIFGLLPEGERSIAYTQNEKQFSLTFWVTNE